METQKGPDKDYSPSNYVGFHFSLGECTFFLLRCGIEAVVFLFRIKIQGSYRLNSSKGIT